MITIVKNDFYRMLCRKTNMVVTIVLITGAIFAAIFISSRAETLGSIALVAADGEAAFSLPYLRVAVMDEAPPMSALISHKYDAVVTKTPSSYEITSIKDQAFEASLMALLKDPAAYTPDHTEARGAGGTILGFLTMFILLEGVVLMYMFADDKEQKQIVRIAASPISFTGYLFGHMLFTFLTITFPVLAILAAARYIFGADIGFSLLQYAGLTALLGAFTTAFSLFLNSLVNKPDTANMIGSCIVTLTSILAGSFYSFEKGNRTLELMIQVLPQKAFLTLADGLEQGAALSTLLPPLCYVGVLTLVLFGFAIAKTRRDYVRAH